MANNIRKGDKEGEGCAEGGVEGGMDTNTEVVKGNIVGTNV